MFFIIIYHYWLVGWLVGWLVLDMSIFIWLLNAKISHQSIKYFK